MIADILILTLGIVAAWAVGFALANWIFNNPPE